MKRNVLAVMIALCAGSAFATGIGNSYGGEGGKGGSATATGGNSVATGGNATGGSATGGSVLGSGNSSSSSGVIGSGNSSNLNANVQGQAQGQIATGGQGGAGGQGGSASAGAVSSSGGNTMIGGSQSTRTDNQSAASNSVVVEGDTYEAKRAPVATAYAAPLTASNGTCQGSTSAGAQGVSFGVSFGSTWKDDSCDMRYDAEALRAAGLPHAAQARLCQKPEIEKAMEAAGTPCPKVKTSAVATTIVRPATEQEQAVGYTGSDPVVRARLGLPPLK